MEGRRIETPEIGEDGELVVVFCERGPVVVAVLFCWPVEVVWMLVDVAVTALLNVVVLAVVVVRVAVAVPVPAPVPAP